MSDDPKFFFGDSLKNAISTFKERISFIDGLLYEHSSLMFYAGDGLGKSVISLQMMLEASANLPVLGSLKTLRPFKVLWVMAERHPLEVFERIKDMEKVIPVNHQNFGVTTELQGLNILRDDHVEKAKAILSNSINLMGNVDIIVIDPIYALVAGGLAKDENDSCITRFSTILQNTFNCSVIFIHHSNRGIKDQQTGERKGEDMYGGRFLSAHFTGIYHITKSNQTSGLQFKRDKMSHRNLLDDFHTSYDPETYISTLEDDSVSKRDKILLILRRMKYQNEWSDIFKISKLANVSTQYIYKVFSRDIKDDIKKKLSSNGRTMLYQYFGT